MYQKPQGILVALRPESDAEAERIYAGLVEGGTVSMKMQEPFWARRFAIRWIISCEKPTA